MGIPKIYIGGTLEAQRLLERQMFDAVVSVALDYEGGSERPSNLPSSNVLKLQVNDITDEIINRCVGATFRDAPTRDHVESLVAFAREHAEAQSILVHCAAGWSRSPAAAIVMLATWVSPRDAVQIVMETYSCTPNDRIIRFGDEVLGLGGVLVEECRTLREKQDRERAARLQDSTYSIWGDD